MPSTNSEKFKETSMTLAAGTECFGAIHVFLGAMANSYASGATNYLFSADITYYVKACMK